ncbi:ferredoxin reductase family protein [Kineobactrum salinum]|uniref:Ferredoxin reductase family protein n=1 Tax=Kineobactrum salinum TaxID=2708301 RepID=A0A6C0U6P0_9GAMM|nr:ferredoxin reductase family protein [Kineobactrum salinum]QIB67676.1 ferredoxin reductase family protein [Kineobactrum salinum]
MKTWQAVAVPVVIAFTLVALEIPRNDWASTAAASLSSGVAALSLMAWAAILSSRVTAVESVFGGLDRVYRAHKWMGIWALGFASFHLVFKADLEAWDTASIISLSSSTTRLVRQLSYVVLVFIVVLALNRKIPYNQWRWWHKLSGPLFLVVVAHWLSFASPIELNSPAGIWLVVVSALAIAAALYKLLFYPFLARHGEYEVTGVASSEGDAVQLSLTPVRNPVDFEPGQFGFLRMKEEGLREPHPFTIANGKAADGHVNFLIRNLGDYTRKLIGQVQVGMHTDLYAPYGRFKRPDNGAREIWIGSGVGISPFVAWLQDESASHFDRVTLFYFSRPGQEFPSAAILAEMAARCGAELVLISGRANRADFQERFAAIARECGPQSLSISFCGQKGLLEDVRRQMKELGIPGSCLQHELFEFR